MPIEHASGGLTFAVRGQQGTGTKEQVYAHRGSSRIRRPNWSVKADSAETSVPHATAIVQPSLNAEGDTKIEWTPMVRQQQPSADD